MSDPKQTGGPADGGREGESRGLALADLCIRRPVFATMMNLLLVVLGWFSFQNIGVDQMPNVDLPIITVSTTLRGASPESGSLAETPWTARTSDPPRARTGQMTRAVTAPTTLRR